MATREQVEAIGDEEYDPFQAFDHAQGADRVRSPYPAFAELRAKGPFFRGNIWELFGLRAPAGSDYRLFPGCHAVTYQAVNQVLRYGSPFSSKVYADVMGPVMGHSLLEMDEPEHGRYRELIEQAFSRKAMERWEVEVIRPIISDLIDRFASRGDADLIREFTFPFPVRVITGLLGLPAEDLPQFHRWAVELINVAADPPRGIAASQKLREYLIRTIEQRREKPKEDMISVLAHAELDGQRLNDEEICAFLRLLLPAGAETTYRSSSNLLFALLTHPKQLEALRSDRSLMPQAIEEGLRWEPPLTSIVRMAPRDIEVAGEMVPASAVVSVWIGSANHDETRWDRSEEFDIFRKRLPHVVFGTGPHVCLGQHLARAETSAAVNALLDRLPNLRLDPEAQDVHIRGLMFRSPATLPVVFG